MMRVALLLPLAAMLAACGLHPLYAGGASGAVRSTLTGIDVAPIAGKSGWLMASALRDRLGEGRSAARYRLEVTLDDGITGLGVRSDDSITRERRTLRARYRLIETGAGHRGARRHRRLGCGNRRRRLGICNDSGGADRARAVVGDGRGSDRRAPRHLRAQRRAGDRRHSAMKVKLDRLGAALDRPSDAVRLILLHGPDESGAMALAARLSQGMGDGAERVSLDGAALRSDPARLAEEAAALSLFGERRWIRVTAAGEESAAAAEALLDASVAGNPVVMIAPAVRSTAKLVKLADAHPLALSYACYLPDARQAETVIGDAARPLGLRVGRSAAQRLFSAADSDRAVMTRELEKLALYLDASPERPREVDDAAITAIGAGDGEGDVDALIAAVVARAPQGVASALRALAGSDASPIPWLRAAVRRLMALADMRGRIDAGEAPDQVTARVFFKEKDATAAALRRWSSRDIAAALCAVRAAERGSMAVGSSGAALAGEALVALARR